MKLEEIMEEIILKYNFERSIDCGMKEIHGRRDRDARTVSRFLADGFTYRLIPDYGRFPKDFEFTMYPCGCCDKENNLFLTSRNIEHPIVMLDAEGNYVRDFGKGLFSETHGIFVTAENTLLCVDTGFHVIRELSMTGELIRDLGNFGKPSDSGFDANIWRKYQRNGYLVPTDIAFKDNSAWMFYEGLRSIKRAAPPFNRPTDVCIAPNGDIYASDGYGNVAVHRFSRDGKWKQTWGGAGDAPGKFIIPHSIWADCKNRIWVGDREGNKINVFDEKGSLIACVTENLYQPTDIFGDEQYVYVAERGGGISIFDVEKLELTGQIGFYNSPLRAHGMCGDNKGNLYLMPLTTYDCHYLMKLERE